MRINIKRLVTYINISRAKQTASSQRKCPHKQELGFLLQLIMEVAFSHLVPLWGFYIWIGPYLDLVK